MNEEPIEPTRTQQTRERISGELVQCKFCSNEFHPAGGTDYKTDVNGDWVCGDCAVKAVLLSESNSGCHRNYASAYFADEDVSTGEYQTKAEARARILEMAAALWPNKPIIEE